MNNISTTVFNNKNTIFLHYNIYHKLIFTSKQGLRLSPTLLTEFGDRKGQMGLGGLQEPGPKRAYLQFWTPVNRYWSTVFIRLRAERRIADPFSRFLLLLNAACLCALPTVHPRSAPAIAHLSLDQGVLRPPLDRGVLHRRSPEVRSDHYRPPAPFPLPCTHPFPADS
jgi:hypothetical protein